MLVDKFVAVFSSFGDDYLKIVGSIYKNLKNKRCNIYCVVVSMRKVLILEVIARQLSKNNRW